MNKLKWFIYRTLSKVFKNKYVIGIDYSSREDLQCETFAMINNGEIYVKDFKYKKGSGR